MMIAAENFRPEVMILMNSTHARRLAALSLIALTYAFAPGAASAQNTRDARDYSDSDAHARARTATARRNDNGDSTTETLRDARTIYVEPNPHIDAEYLEYKLDKLPEFNDWRLSIVKDKSKADLVIVVNKTALNYIFSVVDP
ncbi:MAG: hypothetical protein QOF61_839, partial [Acidobacteriota bacterium]|nr:hypothetical protein [Acidobacteriota bacterium]